MSRGGRGGARGGKRGPDMSWDDEEVTEVTPNTRKPGPIFPERYIVPPKPLSTREKSGIASFIALRDRIRRGPLHATLDPSVPPPTTHPPATSNRAGPNPSTTKPNLRAGFDPFNDQEKYTMKYHRKRRTYPDLTSRSGYTLKLFPLELWSTLDPKRRMSEWNTLTDEQLARMTGPSQRTTKKRKRDKPLKFEEAEDNIARDGSDASNASDKNSSDGDEDALSPTSRRKKRREERDKTKKSTGRQKKGLDAEDDYPDVEQDEDGDGAGAEDEPGDSEFGTDEEDDDGGDDYNAEQYFDDGADEGDDGFGGGDGDGDGVY